MRLPLMIILTLVAHPSWSGEFVAPYVNTVQDDVELLLDLADVNSTDYLIDLGSGDGRFVISAAQRGAVAHGVELDPELVALARRRATDAGVEDRTAFLVGDIFEADIANATVVTLYLMQDVNIRLRPKLLRELQPGSRVLSNSFHMGAWEPDARVQGRTSGGALMWIVPARVTGLWTLAVAEAELDASLEQRFQILAAAIAAGGKEFQVQRATLSGRQIELGFIDGSTTYLLHGTVDDKSMNGVAHVTRQGTTEVVPWSAMKVDDE